MTTRRTNNSLDRLEALRNELELRQVSAAQTVFSSHPGVGQLHHLKNDYGMSDVFVLITGVFNHQCSVIPGSFDAMKGGLVIWYYLNRYLVIMYYWQWI